MATIDVLDAAGATQTVQAPNANGRAAASASRPVALSTEDLAAINAITTALGQTLSISGALTDAQLRATAVPVSGTFWQATQPVSAASLPLPTGAATQTTLAAIETALGATLTVDGSGVTQPVSGTVSVSGSVAVTGTFWQATQPVSVASLPLPAGAATEATLGSIEAALGGTLTVDGSGVTQPVSAASLPLPTGAATSAKQDTITAAIEALVGTDYETVAASQTDQALGATGAVGDLLESLLVIPATTSPGAISIKDGAGSAITVFTGGADSVSTLHPFAIPLGIRSAAGAWSVTTGANVSVIASGSFT